MNKKYHTIYIDANIYEELRQYAFINRKPMSRIVSQAVINFLNQEKGI